MHRQSPAVSVNHYENFPVASWLCPPPLRPPIVAIYHFARTADDLADEGSAPTGERLSALARLQADWQQTQQAGVAPPGPWQAMLQQLVAQQRHHGWPPVLLEDLLSAFRQDCGNPLYEHQADLLDYCRRSANPIGRLLLHLCGVTQPAALARSDAICTALQLINFWQDFSVDHPRGRCYLPADLCRRHGVDRAALVAGAQPGAPEAALLTELLDWTEGLMREGAPLVHEVPGRMGWELRGVVQGGSRVLERIRAMNPHSFLRRPRLGAADLPVLAWRALRMRPEPRA